MNRAMGWMSLKVKRSLRPLGSNRGVSLIEVIVTVGISAVLFASVFAVNLLARQTFEFGTTYVNVHGGTRIGMDWMTKDVRGANQILSSIDIGGTVYVTDDDVLVLQVPSIDGSGNVVVGTTDIIVYHPNAADATILERTVDADAASSRTDGTRTITHNVEALTFSLGGTGLGDIGDVTDLTQVELALTTRKKASVGPGNYVSDSLNSVVELRNN